MKLVEMILLVQIDFLLAAAFAIYKIPKHLCNLFGGKFLSVCFWIISINTEAVEVRT
jgi:hypothetical protein